VNDASVPAPAPVDAAAHEPRWPATLGLLAAIALQYALPGRYVLGPAWAIPLLELVVLVPLSGYSFHKSARADYALGLRRLAIGLVALVNVANVASLVLLIRRLVFHGKDVTGPELLSSSAEIWLTNVIVFALWYWELDRGGPDERLRRGHENPDFLFPQMSTPACAAAGWNPGFIDYVYVAFTNATAFSPTDTMPLTAWAKTLMLLQSVASLVTVTLVAARAVNILQ